MFYFVIKDPEAGKDKQSLNSEFIHKSKELTSGITVDPNPNKSQNKSVRHSKTGIRRNAGEQESTGDKQTIQQNNPTSKMASFHLAFCAICLIPMCLGNTLGDECFGPTEKD